MAIGGRDITPHIRVAVDTTMVCDGKANTKCSYCAKLHKPCLPVSYIDHALRR